MLLSLRPFINFTNSNVYNYTTTFKFRSGDAPTLYFRLIDLALDTADQGFNPQGRPYLPVFGPTDRMIVSTFASSGVTLYATASGNTLTITLTQNLNWSTVPQPGDLLVIPSGSVLSGAGNANVQSYTVLSATNTTITACTISNAIAPVSIGAATSPITFSATPSNDIQDSSYGAILAASIMNVNNGNNIVRWCNQPFPQIDPSIWSLQIYGVDGPALVGTNDMYLTLYQGINITQGYAKSVLSIQPVTTAIGNVPLNSGYGSIRHLLKFINNIKNLTQNPFDVSVIMDFVQRQIMSQIFTAKYTPSGLGSFCRVFG